MINKNYLNKHWTNFLSKEEEIYRFTGQYEVQNFKKHNSKQTESICKDKFKGIWMVLGGNAVSKGRQCFAIHA